MGLCTPDMGAETYGVKVPCGGTRTWDTMYQPLAEGKGASARMGPEEAGVQNREPTNPAKRDHIKAESMDKPAQHGTVRSSVDTVNGAVARGKSATLIRGGLDGLASRSAGSAGHGNLAGGVISGILFS